MAERHRPNAPLRALLGEARWTGEDLARAVNAAGEEAGLSLHYQRPSVAQWLAGGVPRRPVPELIAEALSRRLRRVVTPAAAGFPAAPRPPGQDRSPPDGADRLARLTAAVAVRGRPPSVAYSALDPTLDPTLDQYVPEEGLDPAAAPGRSLSQAHVRALREMGGVFSRADHLSGAGRVRPALTRYLSTTVSAWLRAGAPPAVRRDLLAAAAPLVYLCGFAHFDDGLHGHAQRYYRLAASLADEAGDRVGRAVALRALSVQAHQLRYRRRAYQLAEAAVSEGRYAEPRTRAFLYGQLAVAQASLGERQDALRHLGTAADELGRGAGRPQPLIGAYHEASLAHQRAVVVGHLGDLPGAVAALRESLRHRSAQENRSRALTLARLAELQLASGAVDAACLTWRQFLLCQGQLSSHRADRALVLMRAHTAPHRTHPAVRALLGLLPGPGRTG
ncbi:Tat pathway signal protein [Kitasatospora kazusensis]|uniref:Tat pathway signal protein n=1 Tax=Kitasatospora kazusensis TaxID=407974 RepID=A0ABP5KTA9_9ACTN